MQHRMLQMYHRLPASWRSVAATMRGTYLRAWRYGPESERLIAEAIERDTWPIARWEAWRENRLAEVLHRAATRVPYYRAQWSARRRAGDRRPWDVLANWPILEKDELRRHARAFVADDCNPRQMFHEVTSGTTGKPVEVWWSRDAVRGWYALLDARCRHHFGVTRHDRWAMLGGQLVTAVSQQEPPFWVWNRALNQLYMSSYHLAPSLAPAYLDALTRYRITHLFGYTSSLYALALEVRRQRRHDLTMAVTITNAEPVYPHQREVIRDAFGSVCETYGQTEIVACASECDAGGLHIWPEVGHIEIVRGSATVLAGQSGELVGTSLLNLDMPLVRYRVGDSATLAPRMATCACPRTLPLMQHVDGRTDDVLFTVDGRRVGRLDTVFKSDCHIQEAQIVQESLRRVRLRYVPAAQFTARDARGLAESLRDRLGDIDVVLEPVRDIPRSSRGKFRAVVCALPDAERRALSLQ
jgi:phenylacetate-CoA ligase